MAGLPVPAARLATYNTHGGLTARSTGLTGSRLPVREPQRRVPSSYGGMRSGEVLAPAQSVCSIAQRFESVPGARSASLANLAARRLVNSGRSMTNRPCVPRPISSDPSIACTRNSM